MDMAEEMMALAMAVAVEAPRPPVRDALAATVDDMSKVDGTEVVGSRQV